jgi:hypothetical protein
VLTADRVFTLSQELHQGVPKLPRKVEKELRWVAAANTLVHCPWFICNLSLSCMFRFLYICPVTVGHGLQHHQ